MIGSQGVVVPKGPSAVGSPGPVVSSEIVIVDEAGNEEPYDPAGLDIVRPSKGA